MKKRPTKKKRTLLIDGDIVLYQQAFTNEKSIDWGDGVISEWCEPERATKGVIEHITWMQDLLHASGVYVMVTGGKNFRKELNPSYKANRKGKDAPKLYEHCIEVLNEEFNVVSEPRLEADDLMAIWATDKAVTGDKIICTIDKDLRTVPGIQLFNPKKSREGVSLVTPEEAEFNFYSQILKGDPIDGYYGVRGIGPKKATRILTQAQEDGVTFWDAVCHEYLSAGMSINDALMSARMAHILVAGEYNFKTKEVKLWNF